MGRIKKTIPKTNLGLFIFIALLLCSIFTGAMGADVSSSVTATNTDVVLSDPPSGTPPVLPEAEPSLVDFVDLGQWSTTVDGTVSHALIQGPDGKVYGGTHAGHDRNAHLFSYEPDVGFTDLGQVPPDSPDIYVSTITVHSNGNLYIGTSDCGHLVKYDPNTDTMETVENNVAGGICINQLREGSGGMIYGTTAFNGHLFSYDPDSGAVNDLGQVASGERALFGLAFDTSGDCIFLTSSQSAHGGTASMYRYNLTTQETTSFGLLVPDARWASYNIVQAPDGYVYGGASTTTGEGHLWRFAPDNSDTPPEDLGAVAGESSVDFLALDSDHKVYATTRPNGHLVMFDPADADAGIVDLGQIGPEAHNPIAVGLNDRLYLGVGDHRYIYEEGTYEEPWRYFRNHGYVKELYPDRSGKFYFRFWEERSETAMNSTDNYYYVPPGHANYQASVDLLYLAAESQWEVCVSTERELDENGHAVVEYLFVTVPTPEPGEARAFIEEDESIEPWNYSLNHGYIEHLYPSGSGRFYFDFWQFEESEFCEMAMQPQDYYYVPPDHANYQASVDLLFLAAESQWQVGATTEPELDEEDRAVVQDLHVPVPAPTPTPGTPEPSPTPSTSPPPTPPPAQDGGQLIPEPISDPETTALNNPMVIAANDQCQVMVVYKTKQNGTIHLFSALNSGGSWQTSEVPLPADHDTWYNTHLHDLAAYGSQFALLLERGSDYYYALWSDGSWSTPQEIPYSYRSQRMNFDAQGNLIFFKHSDNEFIRLLGDQFESLTLPQPVLDPGSAPRVSIYRGRTGAIHIVGVGYGARVPTVASLPASADAMQTENWVFNPSSSSDYAE